MRVLIEVKFEQYLSFFFVFFFFYQMLESSKRLEVVWILVYDLKRVTSNPIPKYEKKKEYLNNYISYFKHSLIVITV